MATSDYTTRKNRLNWKLVAAIVLLHIAVLYGLARVLAPELTASITDSAMSVVTVTITTPETPPPDRVQAPPELKDTPAEQEEGAAGEQGREATPREVVAPENPLPRADPAPQASSTGAADTSGAREEGEGTGAGGQGDGTGSGRTGSGAGSGGNGGVAAGPAVRSGNLNESRDFPVPSGGRQTRFGKSVTVHFTVGTDGRARDCTVANTQVDAETTSRVCPLVVEKIRFDPATTAGGIPVESRYGYRVDFRARQ